MTQCPKYTERTVLAVCGMVGAVVLAVIAGVAYCVGKVVDRIA